jgi:hypothetical protein
MQLLIVLPERMPDQHFASVGIPQTWSRGRKFIARACAFPFPTFCPRSTRQKAPKVTEHQRCNSGAVMSEVQTRNRFKNRKQDDVNPASAARVQKARKAGPIGAQIDAEGNNNAAPKKHPPTNGGKSGTGIK